jgi:hypothetical protein
MAGTLQASVFEGDVLVHTPNTIATEPDSRRSITIPYFLAQHDRQLRVEWQFTYVEDGQTYEYDEYDDVNVITPILPLAEVKRILGPEFNDTTDVADIERAVRYIIQAHTGQFFGKFIGVKYVSGGGDSYLRLPMRLIKLNSVNGNDYWNGMVALRGSGWYLQSRAIVGPPPVRADFDGWHEDPWGYSGRVPIVAPYSRATMNFTEHAEYKIDGVWGWNSVPAPVQEAARLLINDYACADSQYRDRFLTSMTAADWRIQFHEGAFSNTGNVRANQLLAGYVLRRGWVVV